MFCLMLINVDGSEEKRTDPYETEKLLKVKTFQLIIPWHV